jgi:hypothetical protein
MKFVQRFRRRRLRLIDFAHFFPIDAAQSFVVMLFVDRIPDLFERLTAKLGFVRARLIGGGHRGLRFQRQKCGEQ